ncbi:tyrosine-type recombinase/integrase [Dactylosporangium sp. NPDC048998]|uniref:tyrosine-type recombinase/integrase n=1 Tax=Dactylosporangium sp. NPDC048998 TaxID=3363976 RepID=UPI0037249ABB
MRPEHVLHRLHALTADAGLPRIRVHDLRHLAATLVITSGVPLAVVSKTLRHSTLSVTVNIYGHLTRQAAHDAVEATAAALAAATPTRPGHQPTGRAAPGGNPGRRDHPATTPRCPTRRYSHSVQDSVATAARRRIRARCRALAASCGLRRIAAAAAVIDIPSSRTS